MPATPRHAPGPFNCAAETWQAAAARIWRVDGAPAWDACDLPVRSPFKTHYARTLSATMPLPGAGTPFAAAHGCRDMAPALRALRACRSAPLPPRWLPREPPVSPPPPATEPAAGALGSPGSTSAKGAAVALPPNMPIHLQAPVAILIEHRTGGPCSGRGSGSASPKPRVSDWGRLWALGGDGDMTPLKQAAGRDPASGEGLPKQAPMATLGASDLALPVQGPRLLPGALAEVPCKDIPKQAPLAVPAGAAEAAPAQARRLPAAVQAPPAMDSVPEQVPRAAPAGFAEAATVQTRRPLALQAPPAMDDLLDDLLGSAVARLLTASEVGAALCRRAHSAPPAQLLLGCKPCVAD